MTLVEYVPFTLALWVVSLVFFSRTYLGNLVSMLFTVYMCHTM